MTSNTNPFSHNPHVKIPVGNSRNERFMLVDCASILTVGTTASGDEHWQLKHTSKSALDLSKDKKLRYSYLSLWTFVRRDSQRGMSKLKIPATVFKFIQACQVSRRMPNTVYTLLVERPVVQDFVEGDLEGGAKEWAKEDGLDDDSLPTFMHDARTFFELIHVVPENVHVIFPPVYNGVFARILKQIQAKPSEDVLHPYRMITLPALLPRDSSLSEWSSSNSTVPDSSASQDGSGDFTGTSMLSEPREYWMLQTMFGLVQYRNHKTDNQRSIWDQAIIVGLAIREGVPRGVDRIAFIAAAAQELAKTLLLGPERWENDEYVPSSGYSPMADRLGKLGQGSPDNAPAATVNAAQEFWVFPLLDHVFDFRGLPPPLPHGYMWWFKAKLTCKCGDEGSMTFHAPAALYFRTWNDKTWQASDYVDDPRAKFCMLLVGKWTVTRYGEASIEQKDIAEETRGASKAWVVRLVIRRWARNSEEWKLKRWLRGIPDSSKRKEEMERMQEDGDLSKTFKVVSFNRSRRTTPVLASAAAAATADTKSPAARRVATTMPTWGLERRPVTNLYVNAPSFRR